MSSKTPKSASLKPKGPHPSELNPPQPIGAWNDARLAASWEWDFPARLLPTRRDETSEGHSTRMDSLLVEAIRESYAQATPGSPTAKMREAVEAFHDAYGQFLHHNIEANSIHVSCGRGCSRCCHHFVTSVHAIEVLCFYEAIRERPDIESLIEACKKRTEDFEGWKDFCEETYPDQTPSKREDLALEHYYDERNPCPFLAGDGACGVYKARPLTCRMYLASSTPDFCEAENITDFAADVFTIPPDESIAERMARVDRAVDFWGHSPDLYRSLARLHDWRKRWLDPSKTA
ncbi:MAG: YkgJ family cysteine cluster protein [Fibrobacterota bacterium]|nr:YkgJ family cysteine cluster protein [Fibrobacterota bacterium]QQS04286.1 MAG: YkgJ family cysteine cluster protein [Fibrobacterota bacterium]